MTGGFHMAEMVKTRTFYLLWFEYVCAATAGLMIIGHLAKIVSLQSGNTIKAGFLFVVLLAVFNAAEESLQDGIRPDWENQNHNDSLPQPGCDHVLLFEFLDCRNFYPGLCRRGSELRRLPLAVPSATADFWERRISGSITASCSQPGRGGVFVPSWLERSPTSQGAIISGISYPRAYDSRRSADSRHQGAEEKRVGADNTSLEEHPAAYKVR